MRRRNYNGLQVVKKSYNGTTIGYIVGWWKNRSNWADRGMTFQSFREGVIFPTQTEAVEYRDRVEKMREGNKGVQFEPVKDE